MHLLVDQSLAEAEIEAKLHEVGIQPLGNS